MWDFLTDEDRMEVRAIRQNSKWSEAASDRMNAHSLSYKARRTLSRRIRSQEKSHPRELLLDLLGPADDYVDQQMEELKAQGHAVYHLPPNWLAPSLFAGVGLAISGLVCMALYLLIGSGSVPLSFLLPTTLAFTGVPFIYNAISDTHSPHWEKAFGAMWVSCIGALGFVLATVWPATKEASGLWIFALFTLGAIMAIGSFVGISVLQSRPKRCPLPVWRVRSRELLAGAALKSPEEITTILDNACSGLDGRDINDVHGTPEEFVVKYWPSADEQLLHDDKPLLQRAKQIDRANDFNPDDRAAQLAATLGPVVAHAMSLWQVVGGRDGFAYAIVGFVVSSLFFLRIYRSGNTD